MGVDINHYVVYGFKFDGTLVNDDEDFGDYLFDKHNAKWDKQIIPDKIYYIPDCYCGDYTVVGYVIDRASYEENFSFNLINDLGTYDTEKITEFLWQEGFKCQFDEMDEPQLMIFTHAS